MKDLLRRLLVGGFSLVARSRFWRTSIGEALFIEAFFVYKRSVEDPFAGMARRHPQLFQGGDIIDVGANVGYTATVFARALSDGCFVLAIEPEPENVERMRRTLVRKKVADRVVIIQAAAGAEASTGILDRNAHHPGDHALARPGSTPKDPIEVNVISIDELVSSRMDRKIAFVKIDVQGWELAVSRGMEQLLASPDIAVAIEYSPASADALGLSASDLLQFYRTRGFRIRALAHDGRLVEFESDEARKILATRGYLDLLCSRKAPPSQA